MAKKINCKHGLNNQEEIRARRIRAKLEENELESDIMLNLSIFFAKYKQSKRAGMFIDYLKREDIVLYSALRRMKADSYSRIMHIIVQNSKK